MFSHKQAAPPPLWAVQVLTPDYLVEGLLDSQTGSSTSFLDVQVGRIPFATLQLTQAKFQAAGPLAVTPGTAPRWLVSYNNVFIAIIPRDEGSTAHMIKGSAGHVPIPGDMFVGPYVIRGTLLASEKDLDMLGDRLSIVVQDAEVNCLLPGSKLTGLKAPYILVRTQLLQGILLGA